MTKKEESYITKQRHLSVYYVSKYVYTTHLMSHMAAIALILLPMYIANKWQDYGAVSQKNENYQWL